MTNYTGLTQKDIELIERVIYKNGDDVTVSIARGFERLEERIDATESRLYSRLAEVVDEIEACRQSEEFRKRTPSPESVESAESVD